ncbi:hypothetical protein ABVT39_002865 [Epinephelus coioides]
MKSPLKIFSFPGSSLNEILRRKYYFYQKWKERAVTATKITVDISDIDICMTQCVDNNILEDVNHFIYLSTRAIIDDEIIACAIGAFARIRKIVFEDRDIRIKTKLLVYQAADAQLLHIHTVCSASVNASFDTKCHEGIHLLLQHLCRLVSTELANNLSGKLQPSMDSFKLPLAKLLRPKCFMAQRLPRVLGLLHNETEQNRAQQASWEQNNTSGPIKISGEQVEDDMSVISTCVYDYMCSSVCAKRACVHLSVLGSMCQPKCVFHSEPESNLLSFNVVFAYQMKPPFCRSLLPSSQPMPLPLIVLLLPVVISAHPVSLALAMMSGAEVRGREDQVRWSWRQLIRLLRYLCLSCC